jgi:cell division transport system permease protein
MMTNILRVLLYGSQGFRRNFWLSIIAIMTMVTTLITISMVVLTSVAAQQQYKELNKKIDYTIFIKDSVSLEDLEIMVAKIERRAEVDTVTLRSKDDARKRFQELFPDNPELTTAITDSNNPLPREVTVTFREPQKVPEFNTFVKDTQKELILETSYKDTELSINRYIRGVEFFSRVGIAFALFYLLTAVLVLMNTVRLTIHSRRAEVEVMRLVGGSPAYIRGPFIVEGVLYGIIGALITGLLSWLVLMQIDALVSESFAAGASDAFRDLFGTILGPNRQGGVGVLLGLLFGVQLAVGILLGGLCAWVGVRRYLREQ